MTLQIVYNDTVQGMATLKCKQAIVQRKLADSAFWLGLGLSFEALKLFEAY